MKILYDQLEKIKEPEFISVQKEGSFLSTPRRSKNLIEKIHRDQFVKALDKIMNMLPLMSEQEYRYRFPSEQAISFIQIENKLMCSRHTKMTWDNIIDLLLTIQKSPETEDPEYYRESDE